MKKFFKIIIVAVVLIIFIYVGLFCFRVVRDGTVITVRDLRSGSIVRIAGDRYCFAYEGAMPWWFILEEMPLERQFSEVISFPVPALASLANSNYDVRVPVRLHFVVDVHNKASHEAMIKGDKGIDDAVASCLKDVIGSCIHEYLVPSYRREALHASRERIVNIITGKLHAEMSRAGFKALSFSISGPMVFPDMNTYYQGIRHINEIERVRRKNDLDTEILESRLSREHISNDEYYKKLSRISDMIKENPDLLKYIYIDKLADKINVVHSIDSLDLLGVFKKENRDIKPSQGEIDNLR